MPIDLGQFKKKVEVQEVKKTEKISEKISPEPEKIDLLIEDELDILTKSIEIAPKKLTIGFEPKISIRKLMAVREMFNLKTPKKVNKKNLSELLIKALKTV